MADETDSQRIIAGQVVFDVSAMMEQLKQLSDTVDQVKRQMSQKPQGTAFLAEYGGSIQTAILGIENAARRSQISLDDLQKKLMDVQTAYRAAGAFDPNIVGPKNAASNDKAVIDAANRIQQQLKSVYNQQVSDQKQMLDEWLSAQDRYYKQVESMDKTHYQALQEDSKRDTSIQQQSIDGQMQRIKAFYDLKLLTAEQALQRIEQLVDEEATYFAANQDKEIQVLKNATAIENAIYAEQRKAMSGSGGGGVSSRNMNGFGMMNPLDMGAMMVQFTAMNALLSNMQQGIVGVDQAEAGLRQVYGDTVQSQSQLNDVTNSFIDVGKLYGQTVTDVTAAAKQWGRQYKDVNTAMELTRSATILSTLDNLSMADANRSLEATMNAMGMAATDQASAMTNSMKIVDSWSALAHEASISAQDLAGGVERSAGAAKQAGLSIDQLNAIISATVRNTGLSGDNAGNMWKSVLANISASTPKVQDAFKQLGITMYTTGADGKQAMKPVYDLIIELSQAAQHATVDQTKYFEAIAGGKYQYSKLMSSISDTKTIQDDLNKSLDSGGKATQLVQEQMHTLHAELVRLSDTMQQLGHDATSGGLGAMLKSMLVDIRYLIEGLKSIPAPVLETGLVFLTLLGTFKLFSSSMGTIKTVMENMNRSWVTLRATGTALSAAVNGEDISTKSYTASLLAKINAARADIITSQAQREATLGNVGALDAEALAARQAQGSLTGMDLAAAGVTLGLSILLPVLLGVAISMGSSSEKASENAQSMQALTSAYDAHKSQVDALLKSYQQLDDATKGGTVFADTAQQQQYFDVMSQINGILPGVTAYVDADGKTHLQSADYIRQEIEQQKQLMQLKADDAIANYNQDNKGLQDQLWVAQTNVRVTSAQINNPTYDANGVTKTLTDGQIRSLRDQREKYQQEVNTLISTVKTKNQELANAFITQDGVQLSDSSRNVLNQWVNNIDWSKIGSDTDSAKAAIKSVTDEVIKLQNSSKDGKVSNDTLNTSFADLSKTVPMATKSMSDLTSATGAATTSTTDQTSAMTNLQQMVSDATTANKELLTAQQELSSQGSISQATLDALIAKYPEFVNVLGQGNAAVQQWIDTQINSNTATLASQKSQTEATIAETRARIMAYMAEIDALNSLIGARMAQASDDPNAMTARLIQASGQAQSQANSARADLQKALGELGYINASYKNLTVPTSKSSGGSGSAASAYKQPFTDLQQTDDATLQHYKDRIDSITAAIDQYKNALSDSLTNLTSHITDTKAASDVTSAYNSEVSQLKSQISALNDENKTTSTLLSRVNSDIASVNAQYKHHDITAQEHTQTISTLNSEYKRLTDSINANSKSIQSDTQSIADATKSVTSEIVSMLQQAYTDEEAMQQTALTNIYQPQIDALNAQKTAIDGVIASLQEQWNQQTANNSLLDLNNQLAAVKADKRYEVVGLDGKLSYTYDTAKASDLEKQIADATTKMQHDAEIQRLNDQKTALDAQLNIIQQNYADAKTALDTYWKYKLSQDNLQQTADNLILQNGIAGALGIVQKYASQIVAQYNSIQSAAAGAAGAMLGGIGLGGGVPTGGGGSSYSMADKNGHIDTGSNYDALVNQHGGQWQNHKWVSGSYISGKWTPASLDTGGQIPHGKQGFAYLHQDEVVLNSPIVNGLKNLLVTMPKLAVSTPSSRSSMTQHLHIARIELPNVKDFHSFQGEMEKLINGVRLAR